MFKKEKTDNGFGRLLDVNDLRKYLSIGESTARAFGRECGAEIRIGRRVCYDRRIIDRAIDNPPKEGWLTNHKDKADKTVV